MNDTLTATKIYLVNPVSGQISCIRPEFKDCCAGSTLHAAYYAKPTARGWLGINGEPFVRMTEAEVEEFRGEVGFVCDCDLTASLKATEAVITLGGDFVESDTTTDEAIIASDLELAKRMVDSFLAHEDNIAEIRENGRDSIDIGGELDFFVDEVEGDYAPMGAFWRTVAAYFEARIVWVIAGSPEELAIIPSYITPANPWYFTVLPFEGGFRAQMWERNGRPEANGAMLATGFGGVYPTADEAQAWAVRFVERADGTPEGAVAIVSEAVSA